MIHTFIHYQGRCPKCGCRDFRPVKWAYQCFKCGHIEWIKSPKTRLTQPIEIEEKEERE